MPKWPNDWFEPAGRRWRSCRRPASFATITIPAARCSGLSRGVYAGQSLASLGIAAHEAGHAIQQASRHPGLIIRDMIVATASLGSIAIWLLILAGLLLGMFRLIIWGLALFSLFLLVQLLNLPIELDASRRRGKSYLLQD